MAKLCGERQAGRTLKKLLNAMDESDHERLGRVICCHCGVGSEQPALRKTFELVETPRRRIYPNGYGSGRRRIARKKKSDAAIYTLDGNSPIYCH